MRSLPPLGVEQQNEAPDFLKIQIDSLTPNSPAGDHLYLRNDRSAQRSYF